MHWLLYFGTFAPETVHPKKLLKFSSYKLLIKCWWNWLLVVTILVLNLRHLCCRRGHQQQQHFQWILKLEKEAKQTKCCFAFKGFLFVFFSWAIYSHIQAIYIEVHFLKSLSWLFGWLTNQDMFFKNALHYGKRIRNWRV